MPLPTLILLLLCWQMAYSQTAPVTTVGSAESALPGTLSVPVSVTGFNDIGAVYLSLDYDGFALQLTGTTPHPQMQGFIHGDAPLGTGMRRVTMGWYGNGLTLPENSAIMTLHFVFTGGHSGFVFYDNGPTCEYANGTGQVLNDIPFENHYINGVICGALTDPGPIQGDGEVCAGQGTVAYSIEHSPNASAYNWSVPDGAVIVAGQNTNLIMVDFAGSVASGAVSVQASNPCGVNGPLATLQVTVNPLPQAFAADPPPVAYGASITLNATVEPGNYAFVWTPEELFTDPYVQNPQTVPLYASALFRFKATRLETGCTAGNDGIIQVTGGPLTVNPSAAHDTICAGEGTMLHALASGGTGSYAYSWTSTPPGWASTLASPAVQPTVTTTYHLEVTDGTGSVSGSTIVVVAETVTATISGTDTLCGTGSSTTLTVDFTGTPPWDFVYTFGNQSVLFTGQETTPLALVAGIPGTYTISLVNDRLCSGTGEGEGLVAMYPVPPTPVIQLFETTLISNACCGNQWYCNNIPIPDATGITCTVTESGSYFVIVTLFNCVSSASNVIEIIISAIPDPPEAFFNIFPNPTTGQINITASMSMNGNMKVTLISTTGSVVREYDLNSYEDGFTLDISHFPPGMYFLKLSTEDGILTRKILLLP